VTEDLRPRARPGRKRRTHNISRKDRVKKVRALRRRDGDQCWICGGAFTEEKPPTIDHVTPRKKGGSNKLPNLRLAHGLCNNQRSNPPLGRRRCAEDDE
jgi:5-methylcytosine-specific restriction endonuclease McrA